MTILAKPAKISSIFLPLVIAGLALLPHMPKANAQSAELLKHFRKFQVLEKAGKYNKAIIHAKRALELGEHEYGSEHKNFAILLNNLAGLYKAQGRYVEAEPLYKRTLKIEEKVLGPHHPSLATTLNNLALLYKVQGRYLEAERLYKRSLEIKEKALGLHHQELANTLNNIAALYTTQGRYDEAEPIYVRSLKIYEKALGPFHPSVATTLNNLAALYERQGRYDDAKQLYKRSLKINEKALGPHHPTLAAILNNLAGLYKKQGRYDDAKQLFKRSLQIEETALGPHHPTLATTLDNLAGLYKTQGRYNDAEPLYKRALKIKENLGPSHPSLATTLNNLAGLYEAQGRYTQAEPLYKRSLKITEKAQGANHPSLATTLNNLAGLYKAQGRYDKAEPLYKRDLKITERALGSRHPSLAITLSNLAGLYRAQRRYAEAEPLYKRSLQIKETVLGLNHPSLATTLNNLAGLYKTQGHHGKAEPIYRRALKITKKALGPLHPLRAAIHNNLATLYLVQGGWKQAADNWRPATAVLIRRAVRDRQIGRGVSGKKQSELAQKSWLFRSLIKSVYRDSSSEINGREMFKTAQWAIGSRAAGALAQMSARHSTGSNDLAIRIRERQDSVRRWQIAEKRMNALRGAGRSDDKLETQMATLDRRIASIDQHLAKEFPDYAALASPKPLTIKQVQDLLGPDEVLILLLVTPKAKPTPAETFVWVVTRDKAVWKRAELGGKQLSAKVALLRKPLTATNTRAAIALTGNSDEGRFDLDLAHELYQKLLGPVQEVIGGKKHLLVVGSGPLTALPFHLLIKKKPDASLAGFEKYQKADWLIHHHAITTLPSVSSLKALRGIAKTAKRAPDPLIGFADPVFSRSSRKPVKLASNRGYASFFRGRNVNPGSLAQLSPLPGTRRELQGIGKILKIKKQHLRYGRAASEAAVKKADLTRYRIVYFATHGLVSGDVKGLGEPALAFSLPAKATPEDDGLLTASEITELKLNAEWLVMSACNTAAGDKPGAEALSGLARAFFYAGAKTLLVSHWPVGDEAAVKLTTHAFANMREHPELGRSEALRQSMLALLNEGGANAHPTVWAPFVVVGEGGGQ